MPEEQANDGWEARVREALALKQTALELTEALFGPKGVFARVGTTREARERLLQHPLYQQAHSRLSELRAAEIARFEADIAGVESRPARLTIQIPRSLHAALRAEAAREGVSLSELIRLKLGFPYVLLTRTLASEAPASP